MRQALGIRLSGIVDMSEDPLNEKGRPTIDDIRRPRHHISNLAKDVDIPEYPENLYHLVRY